MVENPRGDPAPGYRMPTISGRDADHFTGARSTTLVRRVQAPQSCQENQMTRRRTFTRLQRIGIFDGAGGRCHICGQKIQTGQAWETEHVVPLALGGEDYLSNLRPAHVDCHKAKTKRDKKQIAKAVRQRANHLGVKRHQSRPMPGTKASGIKKPFGGGPPIDRKTGKEL